MGDYLHTSVAIYCPTREIAEKRLKSISEFMDSTGLNNDVIIADLRSQDRDILGKWLKSNPEAVKVCLSTGGSVSYSTISDFNIFMRTAFGDDPVWIIDHSSDGGEWFMGIDSQLHHCMKHLVDMRSSLVKLSKEDKQIIMDFIESEAL